MASPPRSPGFEQRQSIRVRIARQRRRLDRRYTSISSGTEILKAGSRFVSQHPGKTLLAAVAAGWLLSRTKSGPDSLADLVKRGWGVLTAQDWHRVWEDLATVVQRIFHGHPPVEQEE